MKTILHLGLGAFHRAHQAVYLQALRDAGLCNWSLVSTNIRADQDALLDALRAQGGAFTLEAVAPDGQRDYRRIEAIDAVPPARRAELVRIGAAADTRIISFTVTEAGYYLDAADALDLNHADIAHDLAALQSDGTDDDLLTVHGALTAILDARRRSQSGPVTLLCCDNLRHNGARSRSGLLQFIAALGDTALHEWVEANTLSPDAMVDRITPRPTPELRERVRAATAIDDAAPVMCEQYLQWVIEDRFAASRPAWERVGVQMVADVAPYEEAKIRLLNASHSLLAWSGALRGLRFIHEAAADAAILARARAYAADAIACLLPSPIELPAYRDTVFARFGNAALGDTIERVAADGYAKLQAFVAPTVRQRLARGEPVDGVAQLPALYIAYLRLADLPWPLQDPALPAALKQALQQSDDPAGALAADAGLWGDVASDTRWTDAIRHAFMRTAKTS